MTITIYYLRRIADVSSVLSHKLAHVESNPCGCLWHYIMEVVFPLIFAICFAWTEYKVSFPDIGFGSCKEVADTNHVPHVHSGQIIYPPGHQKNLDLMTNKIGRLIVAQCYSLFYNNLIWTPHF